MVAGVGFEPHDLRVMSPTSYQAALLRDINFGAGDRGRTGTILSYHGILSPGRLPVSPFRRGLSAHFPSAYTVYHGLSDLSRGLGNILPGNHVTAPKSIDKKRANQDLGGVGGVSPED